MENIRFESKFIKNGDSECWPWMAGKFTSGYGSFRLDGKSMRSHRVAYALYVGPIPPGMEVCHACDNPICVNPEHLFLGTHHANMLDAKAKRRMRAPRGEISPNAVLTAEKVMMARESYLTNKAMTVKQLAETFGVSQVSMNRALTGRTWAHLGQGVQIRFVNNSPYI